MPIHIVDAQLDRDYDALAEAYPVPGTSRTGLAAAVLKRALREDPISLAQWIAERPPAPTGDHVALTDDQAQAVVEGRDAEGQPCDPQV